MSVTNYNKQIAGWLDKIEANIVNFKNRTDVTTNEKVEFITHQYHLVMLINRALKGQVIFVGAPPVEPIL
ncbi:hypothetical protein UFOVP116_6 [uncultured Caudovirales phage]|uniref:Uncharacterized protein n=1 Tax=uncultured Caudovirales phage TaxID=2100421 RepID=A0A6J5L7U2_9CAUD|nr:hypothetical protein UFOVP116_6 [uncultured Caudovirales phage]